MKISSSTTYIFPFLLLLLISLYMAFNMLEYAANIFDSYVVPFIPLVLLAILLTALFYFLFRSLSGKMNKGILQTLAGCLPALIQVAYDLIVNRTFSFEFFYIIEGLLLLWVVNLFSVRYMATLNDSSIELASLFGQHLSIPLNKITKLEQKKNALTLIRELKFLGISIKTRITFCNEELDEFEVDIFTKAFKSTEIFTMIIEYANKAGNGKIRQYTI